MAAGEPCAAELAGMDSVGKIFQWLEMPAPVATAFMAGLGLAPESYPRTLADIDEDDIAEVKKATRVGEQPVNPALKGKLGAAWRIARMATGSLKTAAALAAEAKEAKDTEERKLAVLQAQLQATAAKATTTTSEPQAAPKKGSTVADAGADEVDKINLAEVIDQTMTGTPLCSAWTSSLSFRPRTRAD